MAKPKSYFEPWSATKSVAHGSKPIVDGLPQEAVDSILDSWERSDRNADWIVWGSGMVEPGLATGLLSGQAVAFSDEQIVVVVRNPVKREGYDLKADHLALRMSACVNACRGVADPVTTLNSVRDLLRDLCSGSSDADDPRVVGLLARMLPHGQALGTNTRGEE